MSFPLWYQCTRWKFISHSFMSFIIVSVCPRELRQLACPTRWCFFFSSANIGYLPCRSLVWICDLDQIWPFASGGFELLIDWWFLKSLFWWWSLKILSAVSWDLSLICFSLGFVFCATLCCRRREREVWLLLCCSNLQNLCLFWQRICISLVKKYMNIKE